MFKRYTHTVYIIKYSYIYTVYANDYVTPALTFSEKALTKK